MNSRNRDMTCVLSFSSLYNHPCAGYKEEGSDISLSGIEDYDFNWINTQPSSPLQAPAGFGESRGPTSCRAEAAGNNLGPGKLFESTYSNIQFTNNLFGMCNKTDTDREPKHGTKRKPEADELDEIYVPPKRISPFLNTPKERKDERKKVLKISIQKLKQLEDPEVFLRRSVLINNTMKRLQKEVKEEKLKNPKRFHSKRKDFSSYGVLNNSCLSNSYMFDDPFLSGVHEKITDDMTDTLMRNLRDKLCDNNSDITDTVSGVPSAGESASKCEIPSELSADDTGSNSSECSSGDMDMEFNQNLSLSLSDNNLAVKDSHTQPRIDSQPSVGSVCSGLSTTQCDGFEVLHNNPFPFVKDVCENATDMGVRYSDHTHSDHVDSDTHVTGTSETCKEKILSNFSSNNVHFNLKEDQSIFSHSIGTLSHFTSKNQDILSRSVLFTES